MLLSEQIEQALQQLRGLAGETPRIVGFAGPHDVQIQVELTAVDALACSLREVRFQSARLAGRTRSRLEAWAAALGRQVAYLLEPIGPVEFDGDAGAVLLRSTPPYRGDQAISYYEVLLHPSGLLSLKRFRAPISGGQREVVDMCLTREVLGRLLNDVAQSVAAFE